MTERHEDKLARVFADYFGEDWATMDPFVRDQWRDQAGLLLDYVRQTAFGGLAQDQVGALVAHARHAKTNPDEKSTTPEEAAEQGEERRDA